MGCNHVNNFCFAPIHADTRTGERIYTPTYYYIGHLSKFIRPNAQRVSAISSRSVLLTTSFVNENNQLITVVMNQSDKEIGYKFLVDNKQSEVVIPARGIQTLIL
jgi:glucosylceramidase